MDPRQLGPITFPMLPRRDVAAGEPLVGPAPQGAPIFGETFVPQGLIDHFLHRPYLNLQAENRMTAARRDSAPCPPTGGAIPEHIANRLKRIPVDLDLTPHKPLPPV